jgi:hypothetical protein
VFDPYIHACVVRRLPHSSAASAPPSILQISQGTGRVPTSGGSSGDGRNSHWEEKYIWLCVLFPWQGCTTDVSSPNLIICVTVATRHCASTLRQQLSPPSSISWRSGHSLCFACDHTCFRSDRLTISYDLDSEEDKSRWTELVIDNKEPCSGPYFHGTKAIGLRRPDGGVADLVSLYNSKLSKVKTFYRWREYLILLHRLFLYVLRKLI